MFLSSRSVLPGLALALLLSGCVGVQSGLTLGPGEQFILGGRQRGAYRIDARNIGGVTVVVSEIVAVGDTVRLGALVPGAQLMLRFRAGPAALLQNASGRVAHLKLSITGDTNLGMRYEATSR
ncbi:MAG: hypothetical protein HKN04_03770 [Rhodothermaceae bacterium]|nr:hypothetical protein [Rhodothermaceae bacterium]